jgi:hypothetical protein
MGKTKGISNVFIILIYNQYNSIHMEKKVCTKCKEEKELSEFYYRKDTNKFRLKCKKCTIIDMSVTQKVYIENNKDKIRKYQQDNKEYSTKTIKTL